MKILRSFIALVSLAGVVSLTSCSDDWGSTDPIPGTDVYPTKELAQTYSFEYKDVPALSDVTPSSDNVEVVEDAALKSNVLYLPEGEYVRIDNPIYAKGLKLQNGAAITMWMRTDSVTLHPALFSFGGETLPTETTTERFFFTENSWLNYTKPGQLETLNLNENNPENMKTDAVPADTTWHFVALQLKSDGYVLYVDGKKKAQQDLTAERTTQFSYSNLISYLETSPYLYIGAGNDSTMADTWIDDITVYRNQMDKKDWNKALSGGGEEEGEFKYTDGEITKTIGQPDCSSAWWTEFSNYFRIPANAQMKLHFTNHTNGAGNWNNWNIAITTDDVRGGGSYLEYAVLRSDLWGWGETYGTGTWQSEGYGDWDQFRKDMEGADVTITITRQKGKTTIDAVNKALNGNVYHEWITIETGEEKDVLRAFLIVDGSYLEMKDVYVNNAVTIETEKIGTPDCSAGWWTTFSDYFKIPSESVLTLNFTNHTNGAGNWNNWNIAITTDDDRGGGSYLEYAVLRSDLWGWGETYGTGTWQSEGYGDWDQFRKDMEGADVTITVTRVKGKTTMDAVNKAINGNVYREWITIDTGDAAETIRAFLIVDGSYLEMKPAGCTLGKKIM